jgi:5-formyltetrahydrofolate cyclo-ligase
VASTKSEIRKRLLEQRKTCSTIDAETQGKRLLDHFRHHSLPSVILSYAPLAGEISTLAIFAEFQNKHRLALPKVAGEDLCFIEVESLSSLVSGRFGLEPSGGKEVRDFQECVALVPGVAFSREGHRLGFGKGFYDRFLAKHPEILRIGLAYDFQIQLNSWPIDPTDQAMDAVFTPSSIWGSERKFKLGYSPKK